MSVLFAGRGLELSVWGLTEETRWWLMYLCRERQLQWLQQHAQYLPFLQNLQSLKGSGLRWMGQTLTARSNSMKHEDGGAG